MNIDSHNLFALYEVILIAYLVAVPMILVHDRVRDKRSGITAVATTSQKDTTSTSRWPRVTTTRTNTYCPGFDSHTSHRRESHRHHVPLNGRGDHRTPQQNDSVEPDSTRWSTTHQNHIGHQHNRPDQDPWSQYSHGNSSGRHRATETDTANRESAEGHTLTLPVGNYRPEARHATDAALISHDRRDRQATVRSSQGRHTVAKRAASHLTKSPHPSRGLERWNTVSQPVTYYSSAYQRPAHQTKHKTHHRPTSQPLSRQRSTYQWPTYRRTALSRPYTHVRKPGSSSASSRPSVYERQEIPVQRHRTSPETPTETTEVESDYPTHGPVLTTIPWRDYRIEARQASFRSATLLAIGPDRTPTVLGAVQWDAQACHSPTWTGRPAQQQLVPRDSRESMQLTDRLLQAVEAVCHRQTTTPPRHDNHEPNTANPPTPIHTPTQRQPQATMPAQPRHRHQQTHTRPPATTRTKTEVRAQTQAEAVNAYVGSLSPHRDVQPRHHHPRVLPIPRTTRRSLFQRVPVPHHQPHQSRLWGRAWRGQR